MCALWDSHSVSSCLKGIPFNVLKWLKIVNSVDTWGKWQVFPMLWESHFEVSFQKKKKKKSLLLPWEQESWSCIAKYSVW